MQSKPAPADLAPLTDAVLSRSPNLHPCIANDVPRGCDPIAHTRGEFLRGRAMQEQVLDRYGDLTYLLRSDGFEVQRKSPEDLANMDASIARVFSGEAPRTDESNS